ncbi:hypothetical protein GGR52DRAFT_531972 [Hypoxylon sp. FL1284]|nr:hypothetical protein GGR52DRAFT_531972 [Hypoxylon sp. FL1284]
MPQHTYESMEDGSTGTPSTGSSSSRDSLFIPPVDIPPEVLKMPFDRILEKFPWLPRFLQQHMFDYNPRYLYRAHPEYLTPGILAGVQTEVYEPTFDLSASGHNRNGFDVREEAADRSERYRAYSRNGGIPPVLMEFDPVDWNESAAVPNNEEPVSPTNVPETNGYHPPIGDTQPAEYGRSEDSQHVLRDHIRSMNARPSEHHFRTYIDGGANRVRGGRGGYNQPVQDVTDNFTRIADSYRQYNLFGDGRGGYNQPQDGDGRGGYNQPQDQDDGRGGYNQPQDGGRGGYNQPQDGGRGGYNQPQDGGRGGYNQPQDQDDGRGGYNQPQDGRRGGYNQPQDGGRGGYNQPVQDMRFYGQVVDSPRWIDHFLGGRGGYNQPRDQDDGRGGYNQPQDGRGGYNQPQDGGRGGYNQPQDHYDGRGGYNQPADEDSQYYFDLGDEDDGRGGYNQPADEDSQHYFDIPSRKRSATEDIDSGSRKVAKTSSARKQKKVRKARRTTVASVTSTE